MLDDKIDKKNAELQYVNQTADERGRSMFDGEDTIKEL